LAEKREDIKKALTIQSENNLPTLMLTPTFSHKPGDDLKINLPKYKNAKKHFFDSDIYKRHFRKDLNIVGGGGWKIESFECTTGFNSDHPHYHDFIFPQTNDFNLNYWVDALKKQWIVSAAECGLYANYKNGLDLHTITPNQAKDYVTKLSLELTGFKTKIQKSNNVSMFGLVKEAMKNKQLVKSILHGTVQEDFKKGLLNKTELNKSFKYMKKYVEYLEAIQGTHFIRWSAGLKKHFDIKIKSDKEILEEEDKKNTDFLKIDGRESNKLNPYYGKLKYFSSIGDYKNISKILHKTKVKNFKWLWKNIASKKNDSEVNIIEKKEDVAVLEKKELKQELLF
jgi:hypothetical protein